MGGVYVLVKLSNSSLTSTIEKDTSSTDQEVYSFCSDSVDAGASNICKVRSVKNYQGFGLVLGSSMRGEMGKQSETQQLGMR